MSEKLNKMFIKHRKMQSDLAEIKEAEMKFRKEIISEMFRKQDYGKKEIAFDVQLSGGNSSSPLHDFTVKVEAKKNKKISMIKDNKDQIEAFNFELLDSDEDEAVTFPPKISISKLKKLPKDSDLWDLVEEKPDTPTIKYTIKA